MSLRNIFRLLAMVLPILCFANCGDDDPSEANLFIENNSSSKYAIYVVKALEPTQNASNGTNIMGKSLGIRTIGGKEFLAFKLKKKEYDIYVEWYHPGNYGGFVNDRERANLKINDWVKLVHWTGEGDDYRVMDGTGEVY